MVFLEGGRTLRSISETAQLAAVLQQMAELLKRHDQSRWAERLDHCRVIIENSDFHGVARLLELYRGRRSLNRVLLDLQAENERFAALRGQAWAMGMRLRSDARSRGARSSG